MGWASSQLPPGEQREFEMKCTLALSGVNRLEFTTSAATDLVATTESVTRVEAIADLRLEVKDPEGPVPVGGDASYEFHVHNRGTKAAENVEVMAYFSNGVEPITLTDAPSHRPGASDLRPDSGHCSGGRNGPEGEGQGGTGGQPRVPRRSALQDDRTRWFAKR